MEHLDRYVAVVIEEYKTLRDECKQTTINMWTAMQWTSVLIAALFGVGLNQWNESGPTSAIVFGLMLPSFSFITMAFWLGEAVRLKRGGDYIYLLERKLEFLFRQAQTIPQPMIDAWSRLQGMEEFRIHVSVSPTDPLMVPLVAPLSWETWIRGRRAAGATQAHSGLLFAVRLGFFLMVSVGSLVLSWVWFQENGEQVSGPLKLLIKTIGPLLTAVTIGSAGYWGQKLNAAFRISLPAAPSSLGGPTAARR